MKKIRLFVLTLLAGVLSSAFGTTLHQPALKLKSRMVIKRTAVVIMAAHKAVKANKVYTGNLSKSIAHQKLARIHHRRGNFLRAIHHSRRARILAAMAIKANKHNTPKEAEFNSEENGYAKNAPSDEELDKELKKELPNEPMEDEEVVATGKDPDVDVE